MMKKRTALHLDDGNIVAEVDVLRYAVGTSETDIRSAVWTFFGDPKKPDFYVTSSLLKDGMKGSVHPTIGQFGFTQQAWDAGIGKWHGPPLITRHWEKIHITPLREGGHLHVLAIMLPGIGLRRAGLSLERKRPLVLIPPYGSDTLISLNLVLYQGSWRDFVGQLPGQKAIGVITNPAGRNLMLFLRKERQENALDLYRSRLSDIRVPVEAPAGDPPTNLSMIYSHRREPHEPIVVTELHNVDQIPVDCNAGTDRREAGGEVDPRF